MERFLQQILEEGKISVSAKTTLELEELGIAAELRSHGIKIIIVSQEAAEKMQYIVCRRLTEPLLLPDNIIDICTVCGARVQSRPEAPKFPKRVCDVCFEEGGVETCPK